MVNVYDFGRVKVITSQAMSVGSTAVGTPRVSCTRCSATLPASTRGPGSQPRLREPAREGSRRIGCFGACIPSRRRQVNIFPLSPCLCPSALSDLLKLLFLF
ncbi:unnamed protein product [Pipistrellus nathusii]|uniref:Uncharacterized protein n=1 Tax=Pipistrellus nathusii TaxID=59473 RepID=A0ABN9ZNZ1_PIPNA